MWTERLVERARSRTVIDGSPAMLAQRSGAAPRRLRLGRGFWLCHVPGVIGALVDEGLAVTIETIGTRFCLGHGTGL